VINNLENGGIEMVDIESCIKSLKAAWVSHLLTCRGNWKNVILHRIQHLGVKLEYLLKMTYGSEKAFPEI
jgi:hypothetical protein